MHKTFFHFYFQATNKINSIIELFWSSLPWAHTYQRVEYHIDSVLSRVNLQHQCKLISAAAFWEIMHFNVWDKIVTLVFVIDVYKWVKKTPKKQRACTCIDNIHTHKYTRTLRVTEHLIRTYGTDPNLLWDSLNLPHTSQ